MTTIEEAFELIKRKTFLEKYTTINPTGGINHRFTGRGTNEIDKRVCLTDEDKSAIKTGLKALVADLNKVIENKE